MPQTKYSIRRVRPPNDKDPNMIIILFPLLYTQWKHPHPTFLYTLFLSNPSSGLQLTPLVCSWVSSFFPAVISLLSFRSIPPLFSSITLGLNSMKAINPVKHIYKDPISIFDGLPLFSIRFLTIRPILKPQIQYPSKWKRNSTTQLNSIDYLFVNSSIRKSIQSIESLYAYSIPWCLSTINSIEAIR